MQNPKSIVDWSVEDTSKWLDKEGFDKEIIQNLCEVNRINGKCLLALNEVDFTQEPLNKLPLRDRKCLYISCKTLQRENQSLLLDLGLLEPQLLVIIPIIIAIKMIIVIILSLKEYRLQCLKMVRHKDLNLKRQKL
ncbi:hypothetical protein WA026_003486 [Henosepilachna vigintioctopunctata]|uniref:SAM domain-containing protein n=1 Tax=Henosepilachna vigintioctopunctata TaxID=420089 RepID=A0AAW1TJL0_9CUCU